jgi:hypothetical protein
VVGENAQVVGASGEIDKMTQEMPRFTSAACGLRAVIAWM